MWEQMFKLWLSLISWLSSVIFKEIGLVSVQNSPNMYYVFFLLSFVDFKATILEYSSRVLGRETDSLSLITHSKTRQL